MAKHMRLPNGFGQISKLKQRLRCPYRAMVTVSQDKENGKYKRKTIGYYKTYNEAYSALMDYHNNPYFDSTVTMEDLYEKWSATLDEDKVRRNRTAWEKCESLYNMKVSDVRAYHIKEVVEADMPPSLHAKVHTILNFMMDYAVTYDLTDKNYSRLSHPEYVKREVTHHVTYEIDEIKAVFKNLDVEACLAIIVGCYTGFRPNEMLTLTPSNIDLDKGIIIAGFKTDAGRDRHVPIHPMIKPIIENRMGRENIFDLTYDHYRYRLKQLRTSLHLNPHQPHDTRKTFITLAKKYNMDEYAIKRIVGHAIGDITENIYTERSDEWLLEEIKKIPYVPDLM